ncbi:MAG: dihydroorotase, partial [Clostridia bacterium]
QMMRLALEYCKDFDMTVISHCEDKDLVNDGVMNEGAVSCEIGLKGIPSAAEDVMISREVILAEMLKTKVHIAHVSTKSGAQIIREAKARGVRVTAETCPHYIAGTDELLRGFNTLAKVNPPMRSKADQDAIIAALVDGTIDVIATDHAPHSFEEKQQDITLAPNGISGLETAFALCYSKLVVGGYMTLEELSKKMTVNPATILNLKKGEIVEGGLADLVVVDLKNEFVIDSAQFVSKGKNTPFDKMRVFGKVRYTIVDGQIKFAK